MISRLAAVCREHRLREKVLVAPSLAIGHQIGDALARSGTPWVNLRIETTRTIADAIASFDIAANGLTVLSRAQALSLVERSCDRALGDDSYFAALRGRPGLHRAIQRSIDDLRHAGVRTDALQPDAFEVPRKGRDLAAILTYYEEELRDGHFVDRLGVLMQAIALLEKGTAHRAWAPDALWLLLDGLELSSSEERLLSLLGESDSSPRPPRLRANEVLLFSRGDAEDAERRTRGEVVRLDAGNTGPTEGTIAFRSAVGEENEIRAAFRALIANGTPFDEAEIVYTTRDPYLPLAIELGAEHDVPCTFADGIPATFTRPGQACIALLDWIGRGWHAADLQRAASSGAIALEGISGAAFTRILRKSGIGWGRERYLKRLDDAIASTRASLEEEEDDTRRERLERDLAETQSVRENIAALLEASALLADGEGVEIAVAAGVAADLIARFAAVRSANDGMARDAVVRMLRELAMLPSGTVDRIEAAARLEEAVAEVHVAASNPQPGALHVAPFRSGGWSGRRRVFVVGLDESKHPGQGGQDPVVLDAERVAINGSISPHELRLMADAPRRATEQFELFLRRSAHAEVTLTYSTQNLRDRREQFPAAAFLATWRRVNERPAATYEEVVQSVARDGFVDPVPITATEWWLMRRFTDHERDLGGAVRAAYPLLASGEEAERARASDEITAWDGRIDADAETLDPRRNGRIYSASQLERLAKCPFGYFVERMLRVKPVEEVEFDPERWLDALQFGSLFHEVLETAMKELCAAGEKPTLAWLPRLQEIASEGLAAWRDAVPPPSEPAFERDRATLFTACDVFLRSEEEPCRTVTPKFFEVSYGFDEEEDGSIAMPEPFALPVGGGRSILLRGRIDRVDHDETRDEWHVWDYKSGSTYEYSGPGRLRGGTKVQHAVYAKALAAMLLRAGERGKVSRSGYFFATAKGRGARVVPGFGDRELKEALNALSDLVASGYFPQGAGRTCEWCDYADVCGNPDVAAERIERKSGANAEDDAVQAWLRLRDVE